jgi:hypothetical protein
MVGSDVKPYLSLSKAFVRSACMPTRVVRDCSGCRHPVSPDMVIRIMRACVLVARWRWTRISGLTWAIRGGHSLAAFGEESSALGNHKQFPPLPLIEDQGALFLEWPFRPSLASELFENGFDCGLSFWHNSNILRTYIQSFLEQLWGCLEQPIFRMRSNH